MNKQQVREVAEMALREIKATPKGDVRASIPGVVAGVRFDTGTILFRRECSDVQMEFWDSGKSGSGYPQIQRYALPADLERAAGVVLDAL